MQPETRRCVMLSLSLCLGCVLVACGGSGSSSGDTPTGPPAMIVYTSDGAALGGTVTLRAASTTDATPLSLEVVATELTGVQTMDFTLAFPANLLRFEEARLGDFLGNGATQIVQSAVGAVTLQLTLPGSSASGSGVVTTLDLRAITSGNGRIEFVDPEAADTFGLVIENIDWVGGTVQIVL